MEPKELLEAITSTLGLPPGQLWNYAVGYTCQLAIAEIIVAVIWICISVAFMAAPFVLHRAVAAKKVLAEVDGEIQGMAYGGAVIVALVGLCVFAVKTYDLAPAIIALNNPEGWVIFTLSR